MGEPFEEPVPHRIGEPRVQTRYENDYKGKTETIVIRIDFPPTEQAAGIFKEQLPEWINNFMIKNAEYAGVNGSGEEVNNSKFLGAKGQFADIWRKIWKLKSAIWDGKIMNFESPREMLGDVIGHSFLTIVAIDEENNE